MQFSPKNSKLYELFTSIPLFHNQYELSSFKMIDDTKLRSQLEDLSLISPSADDWSKLNELVTQVLVPENKTIESRPFEREDFSHIPGAVKQAFKTVQLALSSTDQYPKDDLAFLKLVYSIIILCGEHSGLFLWTDNKCCELSQAVLDAILKIFQCNSVDSFLILRDPRRKFHGSNILAEILPKLSKDSWKYYPASVECYSWLIRQIKLPNMKHFIRINLPVCLNIVADFEISSKIIGLNCLCHMIANISKAELHWNIQIEVLQNILKPLFYYREYELILPLIKCTIEVADKSNQRFKDAGVDLKWSYFDEILSIILPMMEYEQDIRRRYSYIKSLCIILEYSNLVIGRWSQRILQIVEDYAKIPTTELDAITALNLFIKKCWPLVKNHWKYINLISGRVIYQSDNTLAIDEAKITLKMLKELLPKEHLIDVERIEAKDG